MPIIRITSFIVLLAFIVACGENERPVESGARSDISKVSASETIDSVAGIPAVEEPVKADFSIEPLDQRTQGPLLRETWTGDLDIMEDKRVIRVLTVYGVGRYYLDGAEQKGLVYELFKRFENFINKRLQRRNVRVYVVFVPVARDQLIPALLEGRGDIVAASLSITPEREQLIDFSKPISKPVSEILVTGPAAPSIESIDALAGQTLFVRYSSSYRESVEKLNRQFAQQDKRPVQIEPVSELLEDDDLIEMVNAGLLPWAIVDDYKTILWERVFNDLVVRDDIVFRKGGRLAWAFRKDSPLLKSEINQFLNSHRQGTLIGNVLSNRYIRDFDWAANALADKDYARLQSVISLFRTYAERYEFDYLMVAALGYQESRLDQNMRSHSGAVGIMQMLPSTAADPKVNIPDIHQVEPNIHAGIKYLHYLRSRYFSDPEIDSFNRTLLAFGAYNAGPHRMIKLRNKAAKQGYDPNQWFDNAEVIAAKEIRRETVQYVANIYKYYIAYKLIAEQQVQRHMARQKAGIE